MLSLSILRATQKPVSSLVIKLIRVSALSFALMWLFAEAGLACRITGPLTKKMEASAQSVFQGRVTAYKILSAASDVKGAEPFSVARITVATTKTLRGENRKQWEVSWLNGNFGLPATLDEFKKLYGDSVEIGVLQPGQEGNLSNSYQDNPKFYALFGNKPTVVQGICTMPYIKNLKNCEPPLSQ